MRAILEALENYIVRVYDRICACPFPRRAAALVVGLLFGISGAVAMLIGAKISMFLGLSETAAMWVMLGVFFSPLLVMAWWPGRS
jgi:hypothetical protein